MKIMSFGLAKAHQTADRIDATPFLSDVYKKGTRASKRLADLSLYGRSMVEMLGVLAIIGVLSVGAIAGYQKAMTKYRLNKFTMQFSDLIQNSITTADQFNPPVPVPGTSKVYQLVPYYIKMGIVPQEMIRDGISHQLYTNFGNALQFLYISWPTESYIELVLDLPNKSKEMCMRASEIVQGLQNEIYIMNVYKTTTDTNGSNSSGFTTIIYGNSFCKKNDLSCLKNQTLSSFEAICEACNTETKSCNMRISYGYKKF